MKKILYLFFSLVILISGLHLSIATHLCGGEIAAVKWSLTGEKGTCGMETKQESCPERGVIHSNCCQDRVSAFAVDNHYFPTYLSINKPFESVLSVFFIPETLNFLSLNSASPYLTNRSPHNQWRVSSVSIEAICVFRI